MLRYDSKQLIMGTINEEYFNYRGYAKTFIENYKGAIKDYSMWSKLLYNKAWNNEWLNGWMT